MVVSNYCVFLYMMLFCISSCCVIIEVRWWLWVIIRNVICWFWLIDRIKLWILLFVFWFRLFVGLLVSIRRGFWMSVLVIVICCCLLLLSLFGWWFVWWFSLIFDNSLDVCCSVEFCLFLVMKVGMVMFFRVVNLGSKWWNWNIKLMCLFLNVVSFVLGCLKMLFLKYLIMFWDGWFRVFKMWRRVFLFMLDLFCIEYMLFWVMVILMFCRMGIFLLCFLKDLVMLIIL